MPKVITVNDSLWKEWPVMRRCFVLIIHDGMQGELLLVDQNVKPESSDTVLERSQQAASFLCCSGSLGRAGVVLAEESVCCSGWCFCQVLSRTNLDALHQQKSLYACTGITAVTVKVKRIWISEAHFPCTFKSVNLNYIWAKYNYKTINWILKFEHFHHNMCLVASFTEV